MYTLKQEKLFNLIEPIVVSFALELWGIQYLVRSKSSLLRIYIDSAEGVVVDDCEKVSRQVSALLDVENLISEEYTLEVSSPGLDCPLFNLEQYERFISKKLSIKLISPYEGRKNFKGQLIAIEDEEIVMVSGDDEYRFPFEGIEHARIIPLFG